MNKIDLLTIILGNSYIRGNRDYLQFYCPFCLHHKHKLGISLDHGNWKCWVCHANGKTINDLVFKLNIKTVSKSDIDRLWPRKNNEFKVNKNVHEIKISLPVEAKPLYIPNKNSYYYKRALQYTLSRNISINDVFKHNIHYFESGKYDGYLAFPSYDATGYINYYVLRSYITKPIAHLTPNNIDKNIIIDDEQINWDEDIILCESKINAITIRRNAIPMGGKIPSKKLKNKIINSNCKTVIICLDGDASDDVIELANEFKPYGKTVKYCKLPPDADANLIGYKMIWEYINNAKTLTTNDIFESTIYQKLMKI